MELGIRGEETRELAETILKKYFTTQGYPYTRHHIESYDQFVSHDLPAIIKALSHQVIPPYEPYSVEYEGVVPMG